MLCTLVVLLLGVPSIIITALLDLLIDLLPWDSVVVVVVVVVVVEDDASDILNT